MHQDTDAVNSPDCVKICVTAIEGF